MDQTAMKSYFQGRKLGFIGAGKMAQAIADGLVRKGLIESRCIYASAPSDTNLRLWREKGMNTTSSNETIVNSCSIVFLAVKPQYLHEALSNITKVKNECLFVSVMAGVSISSLEEVLLKLAPCSRIVRVMPNTPLLVGAGCSVVSGGKSSSKEDVEVVKGLLSELGMCAEVKENMIDGAGVIAGCGPAFMYIIIEAIADGGVKAGLPRNLAQTLAAQTMLGAAKMVLETGRHPGQLKDEVCSPAGTTIAGVQALEDHAVRSAMMAAVEAATRRSNELGKKE